MTKHYYEIKNYANIGTAFDINAYTALVVDLTKNGCEVDPDTAVKVLSNYQVGYRGVHQPTEERLAAEAEERAAVAAEDQDSQEEDKEGEPVVEDQIIPPQNEQEEESVEASKAARDLAKEQGLDIGTIGQELGKSKLTKPEVQAYIESKQ